MGLHHTDCLVVFDASGALRFANAIALGDVGAVRASVRAQDFFDRSLDELMALAGAGREVKSRSGHRYRLERLRGERGQDGFIAVAAPDRPPFDWLEGDDPALSSALSLGQKFASSFLPLAIIAEGGNRVEDLARRIHEASGRDGAFWVGTSCLAHVGPSVLARDDVLSTLFLDDIDRLDPALQARVAIEGGLSSVGLMVSSRVDLPTLVRAGTLDRKLFDLVRSSSISVPPVRERADKRALLTRAAEAAGRSLAPDALRELESYPFPNNVDELWDILCEAKRRGGRAPAIRSEHLPEHIRSARASVTEGGLRSAAERAAIEEAMRAESGNVSAAAKRLGVARSTLYRMLERYGLVRPDGAK